MFYNDDKLKQKYYKEFAEIFISKGLGEKDEIVEDIIDILNAKGGKFIITDEITDRAINIDGNIFLSPSDIENEKLVFHEIFHTLIKDGNRNGLHFYGYGIKEDFSDSEDHGDFANEGAINCLVAKMLNLKYSGEIQNIDNKPIRYKMDSYVEPTRLMEQVDFFVGSKCLVRAMRFEPQILNDKFDKIAQQEGAFTSIRDKLDIMQDIESEVSSKMIEYNKAKEKGDNAYMQSILQEIVYYLDTATQTFQSSQATIIYNCFTKKIKKANSQNEINAIVSDVNKFALLGLAENADAFTYLKTLINQKLTSYSENKVYRPIGTEEFKKIIFDDIEDVRQSEFNIISNNIKSSLTLDQEKQTIEEIKGESK